MRSAEFQFRKLFLSVLVGVLLSACGRDTAPAPPPPATPAPEALSLVATALSSPDRFPGDSEEDSWRKPQGVLEFMGVKPGMRVLDYLAGPGYYSELLSRSVGPNGSVIVYNNPPYAQFSGEKLVKRFENNRLRNATVVTTPTDQLSLEDNSLDGVLFVMSYHDIYWQPKDATDPFGDAEKVTAGLYKALKPGGVVVVVDHVANPGSTDRAEIAKVADSLHRIDPQIVKNDFAKAGFQFDSESSLHRRASDDHTKPVFDDSVRHKTDQFIFKFRKPAQ